MKKFKFKFSKLLTALIYAGIALSVIGFGINVYLVISKGLKHAEVVAIPIIQYSLTFFVSIMLFVVLVSLIVSSYYAVEDKELKSSFGIIKSKYDISQIQTVVLDRNTNKLSVHFENESFIVIVINADWYEEFTDALLKANPKIEFSINSETPKNEKDDNKKA